VCTANASQLATAEQQPRLYHLKSARVPAVDATCVWLKWAKVFDKVKLFGMGARFTWTLELFPLLRRHPTPQASAHLHTRDGRRQTVQEFARQHQS
jgi:hypothetical protein